MREAPVVVITVGPDRRWRLFVDALLTLTVLTLGAWAVLRAHHGQWSLAQALGLALPGIMLSVWLARPLRRCAAGQLAWDGQQWLWHQPAGIPSDARPLGGVRAVLDLGDWMLLRLTGTRAAAATPAWLVARAAGQRAAWQLFRCAVYSLRSTPTAPPAASAAPGQTCAHDR